MLKLCFHMLLYAHDFQNYASIIRQGLATNGPRQRLRNVHFYIGLIPGYTFVEPTMLIHTSTIIIRKADRIGKHVFKMMLSRVVSA